jgi:hypothetical protein
MAIGFAFGKRLPLASLMELKEFLIKANRPHAMGTANVARQKDGSHTIIFREGDWSMHDNFFGGEPYGGRQVIHQTSFPTSSSHSKLVIGFPQSGSSVVRTAFFYSGISLQ